jgi:hypothetical protein
MNFSVFAAGAIGGRRVSTFRKTKLNAEAGHLATPYESLGYDSVGLACLIPSVRAIQNVLKRHSFIRQRPIGFAANVKIRREC